MTNIKVYTRLTLDAQTVVEYLPKAVVSGPVKRDDILRDLENNINVIAIIDGQFHQSLAVSMSEIMDALRCGVAVFGSSSMGALRASELYPHGMMGYGKVYEHIKNTPYFRDDYLGQVFSEEQAKTAAASKPYIDFYFNCETLLSQGLVSRQIYRDLVSFYGGLHYSERNLASLRGLIRQKCQRPSKMLLAAERAIGMGSQKKKDAIGLLKMIRRYLDRTRAMNLLLHS